MNHVDLPSFNVLSLCAGIGGIDLGLSLANPGMRTVCYAEIEVSAVQVLVARMEDGCLDPAPVWSDVKTFDGKPWRGVVDCVVAGYPCQPFSCAGKQRGAKDPRHLWPHVARIIREVQPKWVFLETSATTCGSAFEKSPASYEAWATTLRRDCLQRLKSARLTSASGYSSWGTATAQDSKHATMSPAQQKRDPNVLVKWQSPQSRDYKDGRLTKEAQSRHSTRPLNEQVLGFSLPGPANSKHGKKSSAPTRRLNPRFVEALMGFPIGWTDCAPLEMASFRSWRRTHGAFFGQGSNNAG